MREGNRRGGQGPADKRSLARPQRKQCRDAEREQSSYTTRRHKRMNLKALSQLNPSCPSAANKLNLPTQTQSGNPTAKANSLSKRQRTTRVAPTHGSTRHPCSHKMRRCTQRMQCSASLDQHAPKSSLCKRYNQPTIKLPHTPCNGGSRPPTHARHQQVTRATRNRPAQSKHETHFETRVHSGYLNPHPRCELCDGEETIVKGNCFREHVLAYQLDFAATSTPPAHHLKHKKPTSIAPTHGHGMREDIRL